jgi:hypothetical protein
MMPQQRLFVPAQFGNQSVPFDGNGASKKNRSRSIARCDNTTASEQPATANQHPPKA